MTGALRLRPWTVKKSAGLAFNAAVHRRLKKVQGAMWCISVRNSDSEVVGIADAEEKEKPHD